jgi:hypothetical protein
MIATKKTSQENREFQVASIGFSKNLRLAAFFRFVAAKNASSPNT